MILYVFMCTCVCQREELTQEYVQKEQRASHRRAQNVTPKRKA